MAISRLTCSFPLGRLGWVALWEGQDRFESQDGLSLGGRDGFGAEVEETVVDGMARLGDIEAVDFVGKYEIYYGLDP